MTRKSITPNQIKKNNRNIIYGFLYKNSDISQQDISYALHLSRPTVTTNLAALEEEGLIRKSGQTSSELAGRKATTYSIVSDYRISIGVEILRTEIKIIAIDLYGEKIKRQDFDIAYKNEDCYFKEVCDAILAFKNSLDVTDEQILGIGFAMQALISADKQTVIYGKILSCTGLSIAAFTKYLPYPCIFLHDSECAAISEMWISKELQDAFYLSISKHLGAAIISNREILSGKHGHSSTIEHIHMKDDGKLCYCGKRGCMETLCSISALLEENENLDDFFEALQKGEEKIKLRWREYLSSLANAINLLHLVYDTDFILGGYLAPYLTEADIEFLHHLIEQMTPFEEPKDFILLSKLPKHNITIGAALPFIRQFLDENRDTLLSN